MREILGRVLPSAASALVGVLGVVMAATLGPVAPAAGEDSTQTKTPARYAVPVSGSSARVTAPYSGAIDTRYRGIVNDSYKRRYAPYTWVKSGFSLLGCLLGTTSSSSMGATLSSVNYARALAGLGPVSFSNSTMNRKARQAALIMQANGRLSHDPLTSFLCYTLGGDEAAHRSNLALHYPEIGSGQVADLYLDDRGASNAAVGHRRWLLYPFTTVMGNGTTRNANALTVIGPTSSARPNPRWVRWPQRGYFPTPLEPAGRWSLSSGYPGDSFARAYVQMWKGDRRIYPTRFAPRTGYGMPALVWQVPSGIQRLGTFKVKVGNICRSGAGCFSHTYYVNLFNPY